MNDDLSRFREVLDYDPETGVFTWLRDRNQLAKKGNRAGYQRRDGYWIINIGGKPLLAHRIAWLFVNGEWPSDMIDHVNCDPSDNRIANLRSATRSQNMMNQGLTSANTSGVAGVSFNRFSKKWEAYITVDGRKKCLGMFNAIDDAAAARRLAETEHYGEFARCA